MSNDIPNALQVASMEGDLALVMQETSLDVVLPEAKPVECRWPVHSSEAATAVVGAVQMRLDRIARIQDMAKAMILLEEARIRGIMFAVGGYKRVYPDGRIKESWGTLEEWAQANRGKEKSVKLPFGRLQFRSAPYAVRVPDEKLDAFVGWCNRTGNTHLYRAYYEVKMTELKAHMTDTKRERPTDEQGVTLVEEYPAGRSENFSIAIKEDT